MSIRVLIPVRPFEDGKRRLAPVLAPAERQNLNRCFFNHTVETVLSVVRPAECIVISRAASICAWAIERGLQALAEQSPASLNNALEQGSVLAKAQRADAILSLSCDLPFLTADDITAMLNAARHGKLVIAPDATETGTNALLMSPVGAIAYRYGPSSFSAHRDAAEKAGLELECIRRPGLLQDIDTPEDLATHGGRQTMLIHASRAGARNGWARW